MSALVLLAVGDPVEACRSVQRVVDRAAREPDDAVVVLHVHQTAHDRMGWYRTDAESDDGCIAAVVAKTLAAQGICSSTRVVERAEGTVAEAVAEVAAEIGADLVLVGSARGGRPEVGTAAQVGQLVHGRSIVQRVS